MQAVKKAGIKAPIVNGSYSDNTNALLLKIGLAPTIEGGNFDLLTPQIKTIVSEKLKNPQLRNI